MKKKRGGCLCIARNAESQYRIAQSFALIAETQLKKNLSFAMPAAKSCPETEVYYGIN